MQLTEAGEARIFAGTGEPSAKQHLFKSILIPPSQHCQFSGPVCLLQAFVKIAGMILSV